MPGSRMLCVGYMCLFSAFLQLLAMELGVVSTRLTAADKTEHMKRLRHTSLLPFAPGRCPGECSDYGAAAQAVPLGRPQYTLGCSCMEGEKKAHSMSSWQQGLPVC